MAHAVNGPEIDRQALACRPRRCPAGPQRLPSRATGSVSRAIASRPSACVGHPSLLGHITKRQGGCGRLRDCTAIPPATEAAGFLARAHEIHR